MSQGFISHVHYVSQARKLLTFLIKAKVVHTSTLRWVTIRRKREREGFFEENERTRVIRERCYVFVQAMQLFSSLWNSLGVYNSA